MKFLRYLLLPLTLAAFLLSLIGSVPQVPLYSNNLDKFGQPGAKLNINLVTLQTSGFTMGNFYAPEANNTRINYLYCSPFKVSMRAMMAMALATIISSFFAFLISILQSFLKRKAKLVLLLYIGVAFLCELIFVILAAVTYMHKFCADDVGDSTRGIYNTTMIDIKTFGYSFGVGFVLHIVSLVLLFIALLITPFTQDMWCGKR